MDKITLESSIKRECEEMIAAIREKEAEELRRLTMQYQAAIDSFQRQTQDETDAQIRQDLAKLDNKAALDRQKLNLLSVENFITRLVDDLMKGIRQHPRYAQFLLDAIGDAVKEISGRSGVGLTTEDLAREQDIRSAVGNDQLAITGDPSIRWGGCLVLDEEGGRIFNSTLERIYFRKLLTIRRKVAKILEEDAGKGR